jgi:hypothetical protein
MTRTRKEALEAAKRLTKTFGDMAIWKWNPRLWTLASVRIAPKDGKGYTVVRAKKEKRDA